jgi:hypothetical protein
MPIEIQLLNEISAPLCICDHCRERINDTLDGNALWLEQSSDHKRSVVGPIRLTHKKCNRTFERANPPAAQQSWSSLGLEVFLAYLIDNTKFNHEQAKHKADTLASIGR